MKNFYALSVFLLVTVCCYSQIIQYTGTPSFCTGGNLALRISGAPINSTYRWLVNDTIISGATGVSYTATRAGSYSAIITTAGVSDTLDAVQVVEHQNPVAAFSAAPTGQCSSEPVYFTSKSTSNNVLSYMWNFNDVNSGVKNTSEARDTIHRFIGTSGSSTQTFTVKLTVTDTFGCSSSQSIPVSTKQSPDTRLSGTGSIIYRGLPYFKQCASTPSLFNFTNPSPNNKSNNRLVWGDGSDDYNLPSFSAASHTYGLGTHTLKYIVTGTNGCIDTSTYYVFVGERPNVGVAGQANDICTGTTLTFSIDQTKTSQNSAETIYTLTFNDKTPPIVLPHPPPLTFPHKFDTTSCGAPTTGNYTNSFYFSVVASNACSDGEGLYRPIFVSTKPVPSISVSPNDTTCVGSSMTFTNTSFNKLVANGACSDGSSVWSISPSTGWTKSGSSDLGDDYSLGDPSSWKSGSKALSLTFTTSGTYTIKLKTGTSVCGTDSVVKTICVNPMPTGSFTLNRDTGCAPLDIAATSTIPAVMSCGNSSYEWSVQYNRVTGCLPDTARYIYLQGTNSHSANPQFRFVNPGTYTILLKVTAPGGVCSLTLSKTILVRGKTIVSITAPNEICVGNPFVALPSASCFITTNTTYSWIFTGGSRTSSLSLRPDTITYSKAGSYNYSITATNICGDTTFTKSLLVNELPNATVNPKTQSVCSTAVTLTAVKPDVGTGAWTKISGPGSPSIASAANPITTVTGLQAGTYQFQWKVTNGTCSDADTVVVNVTTGGAAASAGKDTSLCNTASVTLRGNTPAAGSGQWSVVSGPNKPSIITPDAPTTQVTGIIPGEYIFRWTVTNGTCSASSADVKYTVSNTGTAADAGNPINTCGTSVQMKANTPTSGTGKWSKISGPNSYTITNASDPATTITGLTPGTYIFTWTISSGACQSSANDTVTVAAGAPAAQAGPDQILCRATSASLKASIPSIGSGAWSFISGPNTPSITPATSPQTTVAGLVPGTYTFRWTISFGSCTPTNDDVEITVSEAPSTSNAGSDQTVCASSVIMQANTPVTGTGKWTLISGPNTPTIVSPSSPVSSIIGLVQGDYVFQWTISNNICPASSAQVRITVGIPSATAVAGPDQSVCSGSIVKLAGNNPTGGTGKWTLLNGPNTPKFSDSTLPSVSVSDLIPGSYTFRWSISNGSCPPSTDEVQVNVVSLKASFTPQTFISCNTDTTVLYSSTTSYTGTDPVQQRWLIDNQTAGTGTTLSYRYQTTAGMVSSRTYAVWLVSSNSLGCADTLKGSFTVRPSAKASFDLTNSSNCAPFIAKVNNTSANATGYRWLVNGVMKSSSANPELLIEQPATAYTIMLIAENSLGCRPDTLIRTLTTPAKPAALFSVNDTLGCDGYLNVSVINRSSGATDYSWIWGDGTGNSSLQNPTHLYTFPGTYPITLIAGSNGCYDTTIRRIKVAKKPVVDFSSDRTTGCDSLVVRFTNLTTPANYVWTFGDGTQSTVANPIKRYSSSANPFTVKLVATDPNGCKDSVTKANLISVTEPPKAGFTISPRAVIEVPEFTFTFLNTTLQNIHYTYTWNLGDASLPVTTRDLSHRYADTGKYTVTLTVLDNQTNCVSSLSQIVRITSSTGYLFVPNAFQPGSTDPRLKTFLPIGKGLCSYRLQIFTTWGQKVFETVKLDPYGSPLEGWNGQYNGGNGYNEGKAAQQDVYVWRIDAFLKTGNDCKQAIEWKGMEYPGQSGFKRVGTITLVR